MNVERIKKRMMKRLVASASPRELNEIVSAVLTRYGQLYTNEEVVFLSLPKQDKEERQRILRAVFSMEQ